MLQARIGDIVIGTCFLPGGPIAATGIISTGDPLTISGGTPAAYLGGVVIFPCGTGIIMTGTPTTILNLPAATLGSPVAGGTNQGIIATGNPTDIV